jgi:hypothetical protein
VRWLNNDTEAQDDHDIEIRLAGADDDATEEEWRHIEVKTRWHGSDPRMNRMSDRQRGRLQDPGDTYVLLVVGNACRLFESPASPPCVNVYEVAEGGMRAHVGGAALEQLAVQACCHGNESAAQQVIAEIKGYSHPGCGIVLLLIQRHFSISMRFL